MDKDRVKGKGKEAMGSVREKTGEMTDDEEMEARGESQKTEGKLQGAVGKIKDKIKDITD